MLFYAQKLNKAKKGQALSLDVKADQHKTDLSF